MRRPAATPSAPPSPSPATSPRSRVPRPRGRFRASLDAVAARPAWPAGLGLPAAKAGQARPAPGAHDAGEKTLLARALRPPAVPTEPPPSRGADPRRFLRPGAGTPERETDDAAAASAAPPLALAVELFAPPRLATEAPAVLARAAEAQALADRLLRSLRVGRVRGRSEVRLRLGDRFEGLELRLQDTPAGVTLTVVADPGRAAEAAQVGASLGRALEGRGISVDVA